MAGPSGIKLNDLHVTDRGHTTEMFSASRKIGKKSLLREKLEAKSKSWRLKFQDFMSTACWAIATAAFLFLCHLGAGSLLEWADAHGEQIHSVTALLNSAFGPTEARMLTATLLALCLLLLLELSGVLRVLRDTWSFQEQEIFDEHTTFGKAMKLEADMIHFGNLPVSYDYTEKGLVVRSLGDRFVAVFALPSKVEVTLQQFDAAEDELKPWFGSKLTPPLIVELEEGSYKSKLILHGAHFETPGAPRSSSLSKAQKFKKAIEAPPRPDHGASGSH